LVAEESAVDALVAVVGLRGRGSWRRLETPASLVLLNEEPGLLCLELLEKLCFIELDGLNISMTRLPRLENEDRGFVQMMNYRRSGSVVNCRDWRMDQAAVSR